MKLRAPIPQVLIGLALLIIPFITSPDLRSGRELIHIAPFQRNFLVYVLLLLFFYLNYYLLIPKLYIRKKYFLYISVVLSCYLIVHFIPDTLIPPGDFTPDFSDIRPPRGDFMPRPGNRPPSFFSFRENHFFQFFIVLALSLLMSFNDHLKRIQKEKLIAEVSYLKAQINPHFLFNTLNSLYALALAKSDEAPEAILKLSGMMRYVVTESNRVKVALQKELDYLNDYVELQRLRLSKEVLLSFKIKGNHKDLEIVPLILITYIENAFKYGINPDEKSAIDILINIKGKNLILEVKNRIVVDPSLIPEITQEGLKNTKKRLDYLYPNKYHLNIDSADTVYHVKLQLDLS